jgi:hypothetical protein
VHPELVEGPVEGGAAVSTQAPHLCPILKTGVIITPPSLHVQDIKPKLFGFATLKVGGINE